MKKKQTIPGLVGKVPTKAMMNRVRRAAHHLAIMPAFEQESSVLPWRQNRTPYRIFLAEFLLVRTRFDSVVRVFDKLVACYPDISSLASADFLTLNELLQPLGLSKRVPYLQKAASYLMEHYQGKIPKAIAELLDIPGIGAYTAAAIAAFAYQLPEVPADVNILRFISRLTGLPMTHKTKGSAAIWSLLPLLSSANGGPSAECLLERVLQYSIKHKKPLYFLQIHRAVKGAITEISWCALKGYR